jgi:hypothetical protein
MRLRTSPHDRETDMGHLQAGGTWPMGPAGFGLSVWRARRCRTAAPRRTRALPGVVQLGLALGPGASHTLPFSPRLKFGGAALVRAPPFGQCVAVRVGADPATRHGRRASHAIEARWSSEQPMPCRLRRRTGRVAGEPTAPHVAIRTRTHRRRGSARPRVESEEHCAAPLLAMPAASASALRDRATRRLWRSRTASCRMLSGRVVSCGAI